MVSLKCLGVIQICYICRAFIADIVKFFIYPIVHTLFHHLRVLDFCIVSIDIKFGFVDCSFPFEFQWMFSLNCPVP